MVYDFSALSDLNRDVIIETTLKQPSFPNHGSKKPQNGSYSLVTRSQCKYRQDVAERMCEEVVQKVTLK